MPQTGDNEESYPLAVSVAQPGLLEKYIPEEEDVVKQAEEKVVAEVDSYLSLLSATGEKDEKSITELAAELRALSLMAVESDAESSVLVIYDIDASGEQKNTPRKSPVPLRKEHLEKVIKATVGAREKSVACSEVGKNDADLPQPHTSDLLLVVSKKIDLLCSRVSVHRVFSAYVDTKRAHLRRWPLFEF